MTDTDERGQSRPRTILEDPTIVKRLICPQCHHVTKITRKWRQALIKQLDPKYPSQTVTIDCKCGLHQFIVQATFVPGR